MKKILFITFFLVSSAFAFETYVEFKPGARGFTGDITNEIDPNWNVSYGAQVGMVWCKRWGVSLNYSNFHTEGRSIIENNNLPFNVDPYTHTTDITLNNLDVIGNGFWPIGCGLRPYVGIGPRISFVAIHNDSPFVDQKVEKTGVAGLIVIGMQMSKGCFFLDPFIEYTFFRMSFDHHDAEVIDFDGNFDTVQIGLGIGVRF